MLFCVG